MHICLVPGNFPTRSATFIREHALGLIRRGHRVTVLSSGPGEGISAAELEELSIQGIAMPVCKGLSGNKLRKLGQLVGLLCRKPSTIRWLRLSPPWHDPGAVSAIFQSEALAKLAPDIIHIHFGTLARQLHRIGFQRPVVVTWHGYDANMAPRFCGEGMFRDLFQAGWRHTVGSDFMRRRLINLGAEEAYLSQIPMGIDLAAFPYWEKNREAGTPLRMLSVGRLDEMKGHCHLIQAVTELREEGLDIILRIVGEGYLRGDLMAQIIQSESNDHIQLLGALTSVEVSKEMESAHLFALTGVVASTGRVETQGVVFAEAQASGLPVIGSSIGGVSESLIDGETGRLCPPGDVAAIKEAIRFFERNRELIPEFGRRGRSFVEKYFSIDGMLDAFEYLYQKQITSC